MTDKPKLLGVCLTEAHNLLNTVFLDELNNAARAHGYALLVFNSSLDLSWYPESDLAVRGLYRSIPYSMLSALLIVFHSFHDDRLADDIIAEARANGIPVLLSGAERDGCCSVVNDYKSSFKSLMQHVIRDHGVRDTFFISGRKGERNSEDRLQCYREVLAENGLPWQEENVVWGDYRAEPAAQITAGLIRTRSRMPGAIFCANDEMALAVCETLKAHHLRVPEDVIVTGFDGIPAAFMAQPQLATCRDDPGTLAEQIMDRIIHLQAGEAVQPVIRHVFRCLPAESCGCPRSEDHRYSSRSLFNRLDYLSRHENTLYHRVQSLLTEPASDAFLFGLSSAILPDSAVFLNAGFLDPSAGTDYRMDHLSEHLIMIPHSEENGTPAVTPFTLSTYLPPSFLSSGITVLTAVHSENVIFGYYAAHTDDLLSTAQLIKRLDDVLNLVFTIRLGSLRQEQLLRHLEDNLYTDSFTGLSNLKGLTRWFDRYCLAEDNHRKPLALSVYSIQRFSYIYENYGITDTEEIIRLTRQCLMDANPDALKIARISEDQFAVVDTAADEKQLSRTIQSSVSAFYRRIEAHNNKSTKAYYVEINSGCTTMDSGWDDASLENLIRLALGELYLNRLREGHREAVREQSWSNLYSTFSLLMEKNLFRYYFQPIVDTKTGQIQAYEALMRTDSLINMMPEQILAVARETNRLDELEQITVFGIMERFIRDYASFQGRSIFINTIPGHFLSQEDCDAVLERFESYLDNFVFEITEQDSTTDEELTRLKHLCRTGSQSRIAIDDFGTGHSNIVNLLRYSPQIIKIDRALIADIENDSNRQLFVRNTIDFAHQNGIKALAEGVETFEEMRTVISFGVDLIQGFYTCRPSEHPAAAIPEKVRTEIRAESLRVSRLDQNALVYVPASGENINLFDLALNKYTSIELSSGEYTVTGDRHHMMDLTIRVADEAEVTLTLNQITLRGNTGPCVVLGNRSHVKIVLREQNTMQKEGIRVPPSAFLTLSGDGDLEIVNSRNYSVGIGANYNDPYGTIVIDMTGTLSIRSSGDRVICLGGGRSAGDGIALRRGNYCMTANGIYAVGLGSAGGAASVETGSVRLDMHIEGNDALGIGSAIGNAHLVLSGNLKVTADGERATGIGTLSGSADVSVEHAYVKTVVHCDSGVCMGTSGGEAILRIVDSDVRIHGEGNEVAGFGSLTGACDTRIESGEIHGDLLAAERLLLGNQNSRVIITGGNIHLFPENGQTPVSPAGHPLHFLNPEEDHFEQEYRDERASWTYTADRNQEGFLGVFIPG